MAGVKQFDEGAVLDEMMKVFWARGYEATSIDELVKATGLKRGSLYNAFGDKDQMFLAAVNRYRDKAERPLLEILADPDPRRALERMFEMEQPALRPGPAHGVLPGQRLHGGGPEAGRRRPRLEGLARGDGERHP